jgi:hypothetical protein
MARDLPAPRASLFEIATIVCFYFSTFCFYGSVASPPFLESDLLSAVGMQGNTRYESGLSINLVWASFNTIYILII